MKKQTSYLYLSIKIVFQVFYYQIWRSQNFDVARMPSHTEEICKK